MDYYLITIIISMILFVSFTVVGISEEQSEDVVGDILEQKNISRNPPEINQTGVVGGISSFDEGPVVVIPP